MAQTKQSEVVRLFHKYMGKNPTSTTDWDTVRFLETKSVDEIESRLSKNRKEVFERDAAQTTSNIDPIKVAQGLGYTEWDMKQDRGGLEGFKNYWGSKSKAELEEALMGRGDYSKDLGRKMTPTELQSHMDDKAYYESLGPNGKIIEKMMENINVDKPMTEEELRAKEPEWRAAAEEDLKDYYADTESRDMEDLRDSYSDIRNEAGRWQQQEEKGYKETLAKTKQNLRARGLTFSGRSRGVLGKEGALMDKGIEGELPQQRRYNWEDKRAGWQERSRDIGTAAERRYGSDVLYEQRDFLNPEGLPDPYGDGLDYGSGRKDPLYLPKKEGQRGYVGRGRSDVDREKELEIQRRIEDRKRTYRY